MGQGRGREPRWQSGTGAAACTPPWLPARWHAGAVSSAAWRARERRRRARGRALLPYDMNWFCHRRALARSVAAKKLSTQKMTSDGRFRNMMGVIASACARPRPPPRLTHARSGPRAGRASRPPRWARVAAMDARRRDRDRAKQPRTPRCT